MRNQYWEDRRCILKIKDLPEECRPRERAIKEGVHALTLEELLAILIGKGSKDLSSKDVAINLIKKYKTTSNLVNISYKQLLEVKGIGPTKAIELLSALELGKRLYLKKDNKQKITLKSAEEICKYMEYLFYEKKQEHFYCIYLDNKCEVIERRLLFMGTINRSIVHPREIFKYAYLDSASSIICVHNHPSGNVKPSREDIRLTESLVELGKINAIPIVDHIIIGNSNYYSFYEDGKILNL